MRGIIKKMHLDHCPTLTTHDSPHMESVGVLKEMLVAEEKEIGVQQLPCIPQREVVMSNWSSGPSLVNVVVEEAELGLYAYKYMNIELYDGEKTKSMK